MKRGAIFFAEQRKNEKMADKYLLSTWWYSEIGKNMFAINYDQDIIILDAG